MLPGLTGADLAALGRGDLTEGARALVAETARAGLACVASARATRVDRRIVPALLPTLWAARTLHLVERAPEVILGQLDDVDRPFDGLRLAWRVLRGRW